MKNRLKSRRMKTMICVAVAGMIFFSGGRWMGRQRLEGVFGSMERVIHQIEGSDHERFLLLELTEEMANQHEDLTRKYNDLRTELENLQQRYDKLLDEFNALSEAK